MTTKKYLEQIHRCDVMIRNKRLEYQRTEEWGISTTVPTDKEKIQSSGISDLTGKSGTELADISKHIEHLVKKRRFIIAQIDSLEDTMHYEVLTMRYVLGCTMAEIADRLDRSDGSVAGYMRDAHEEFEKKYGDLYLND